MLQWFEIQQIAQSIHLNTESDALLWMWEANGVYSVKFMYALMNFRGFIWKLKFAPKIHFFLWLMAHNKLLTRDNLSNI
jgi:hypothetical protein